MTSKSGILKTKSNYEHRTPDFLVFGYQCKLFRDDARATEFDRETHLIPAPYEPKDFISRYDVRATLSDIAPYEASSSLNRFDGLSAAEQQAELLAEEERYYSLYINEVEEELYKEEEAKRQAKASDYNQVQFSYDEEGKEKIGPKESADVQQPDNDDGDDTPFTPPETLNLPSDMDVPATVKTNQIIEKTAKFIASQGLQMEILLKTKQAGNPQFNFLNHDGQYNAYYKHIMLMMKGNTYPWQETSGKSSSVLNENSNSSDTNEAALNGAATPALSTIVIPKIQYKPSADCHYTQLISKITKAPISELEKKMQQEEESKKEDNTPKISSGLLGLSNYNSDSDDSDNEEEEQNGTEKKSENDESEKFSGEVPPSDIQMVIDKTAVYVAKNGIDFEQKLIHKQDTRFEFLHDNNKYHAYYKMKVKSYLKTYEISSSISVTNNKPPTTTKSTAESVIVKANKVVEMPLKAPPAPVCFSIKTKEERPALRSTRIDISDEEKSSPTIPDAPSPPRITSVEEELERQVDIINAEREEKLLKERLNEKLLSAAREKLGMLPKEKMLQIERKKKAMMFINQIKGSNGNSSKSGNGQKEDEIINLTQCGEDSNDSVKSANSVNVKRTYNGESRSRARKRSSRSSSSSSSSSQSSRSRSYSSSDSSPRRKRSRKHKSKNKKRYRRSSKNRSRSRSRSRSKSSSHYRYSKRK